MPVFKHQYIEYDPKMTPEENLRALFEEHNALIRDTSNTINNIDEENLGTSLQSLSSSEGASSNE